MSHLNVLSLNSSTPEHELVEDEFALRSQRHYNLTKYSNVVRISLKIKNSSCKIPKILCEKCNT